MVNILAFPPPLSLLQNIFPWTLLLRALTRHCLGNFTTPKSDLSISWDISGWALRIQNCFGIPKSFCPSVKARLISAPHGWNSPSLGFDLLPNRLKAAPGLPFLPPHHCSYRRQELSKIPARHPFFFPKIKPLFSVILWKKNPLCLHVPLHKNCLFAFFRQEIFQTFILKQLLCLRQNAEDSENFITLI